MHANDDWCGLHFPVFYAVTAIPHIVDVISVSDILVVLLLGMSFREHMPMMTGVGLYLASLYTVTAIPHIIDMISVSDTLVVGGVIVLHLLLQWEY